MKVTALSRRSLESVQEIKYSYNFWLLQMFVLAKKLYYRVMEAMLLAVSFFFPPLIVSCEFEVV